MQESTDHHEHEPTWQARLAAVLPRLGHRNWLVIADAAYPAQSRAGIETLVTGTEHLAVLQAVLAAVDAAPHVRPLLYLDAELAAVAEEDAGGVTAYRQALATQLAAYPVQRLPHEEIIARLDAAGARFEIVILKTTLTIPYTSVFVQLDCGYWSAAAEERLRASLA